MILSKDSNNNWTPTAGGTGTFIGTLAAFNAIKDTLPVNTVAYITDDGNGDLQPVDAITDGNMHPVTSNAVYDYPIDSITDGQHRPPTSNAVYAALIKSTLITPTANSTYLTITSSNIQKTGKIVTVSVLATLKAGTNNGSVILTGLPAPTTGSNTSGVEVYILSSSGAKPGFFQADGSLRSWYTVSADENVRINFTYTTKSL